jgi:lipopolysaccharide biosynthesis glycosyltransferase
MKNKNAICVVSIGRDHLLQYSLPTIEHYGKKYNADVRVIKDSKWNFDKRNGYNYLTFEKYQAGDVLEEYERVLRLDSDVIVSPSAPNLFDTDPNIIYATREDVLDRRYDRLKQIHLVKQAMGNIPEWNDFYINGGVVLASKKHKEIYTIKKEEVEEIYSKNLGPFKEQTFLNWRIRKNKFPVCDLGPRFNRMSMFKNVIKKEDAFIIHYAGSQLGKEEDMKNDFEKYFRGSL